jgi:type IV secretory pathway VirB2 component (pilin)
MINLILKKLSVLFVLTLLVIFTPTISGNSDVMAACNLDTAETGCVATSPNVTADCNFVAADGALPARCDGGSFGSSSTSRASFAQANDNALVDTLCNIFSIATGNGGKAFAAFAIISLGIGFFTGKVSWGLMIGVAAGIAAMFGAPTIVSAIGGDDVFDCSVVEEEA